MVIKEDQKAGHKMNRVIIYNADSTEKVKFYNVIHLHIASTAWGEREVQVTCQEGDEANTYSAKLQRDDFIGVW